MSICIAHYAKTPLMWVCYNDNSKLRELILTKLGL